MALIISEIFIVGVLLFFTRRRNLRFVTSNFFTVLTFVCLFAAIGLILWGENKLTISRTRLKWPTTTAVVVESKVIGDRAFRPDIIYEYTVAGQTYQGDTNLNTPGFGNKRSRRDTAERIIRDFEENQPITVYYNPDDPAESYIRPGPQWSDYMKFGIGHLLFMSALFSAAGNIIYRIK